MNEIPDNELVKKYLEGDIHSIDIIMHRYTKVLYRFLIPILQNEGDIEDCIQNTFIKVWKHIKRYDPEQKFKNWIFTIAKRTALDTLRKRKNVSFSEMDNQDGDEGNFEQNIPDEEILPDELFEKKESAEMLAKILKNISPENQSILLLHHVEDMTFEEISEILEKPMNTIKSQYRRSLIKLRNIVKNTNAPKQ